jgi:outer membrane protein assembly factor BamD (BamD/ComL family)
MTRALQRRTLRLGLILALGLGALSGCAYYNLFYNAQHAFEEAEELGKDVDPRNLPTGGQKTKYRNCIQKCELVLEEYPDSGYVDDALLLMGKSNYRIKEPTTIRLAIQHFDNLLANFPNSEFRAEALYLKGLAHLAVGEEQVALDNLARLRESEGGGEFAVEALYQLGDTYAAKGDHATAARYYGQFLDEFPKHDRAATVALSLARSQAELDDHAAVVATTTALRRDRATRRERFESQLLKARSLNELGRSDEAAELVESLAKDADFFEQGPATIRLQGEIELARGREARGLQILEALAVESQNKPAEADARLSKARYFLAVGGPGDERLAAELATSIEHKVSGESGDELRELDTRIGNYRKLQAEIAESDSVSIDSAFALAELLLTDLDRPREALVYYLKALESAPDSSAVGSRAAFAAGHIYAALDRPDSVQWAQAQLRRRFPESPQARSLDGELFLSVKPRTAEEIAAILARGTSSSSGRPGRGPGDLGGGSARAGALRRSLARGGPGATLPRDGSSR